MASQGVGSPYRQELPHRARVEVALWTAPRFAGRLGALSLLTVGVIVGASPTFVALRCRRDGDVRACLLVEHRALWTKTRPLDVHQVDGVAPNDSPGFTLLDTERAVERVPKARQLPLPRRALYQTSEDEWRDDASLETWANDFFGRPEPARILVRHHDSRHGIPWLPPMDRADRWKFRSGERFAVLQPVRGVAARASPWISLALPLSALVWLILAERRALRFGLVVDPAIGRARAGGGDGQRRGAHATRARAADHRDRAGSRRRGPL